MWIYCYIAVLLWTFLQILPSTKGDAIAIPIRAVSQKYSNANIVPPSPEGYQHSSLNLATPLLVNGQIVRKCNPNLTCSPIIYKTIDSAIPSSSKNIRVISSPVIVCSANNVPSNGEDCSKYPTSKVLSIPETTLCSSKNTFPSRLIINISPSNCNSEISPQNADTSSENCSNSTAVVFRKPIFSPQMTYDYNVPTETFKPQLILRDIPAQPLRLKSRLQRNGVNCIKQNAKSSFPTTYPNPQCNNNLNPQCNNNPNPQCYNNNLNPQCNNNPNPQCNNNPSPQCNNKIPNPLITKKPNGFGEYRSISTEYPCLANNVNNMQQVCDPHLVYPYQNNLCQGSLPCDTVTRYSENSFPNCLNDNISPIKDNICTYRPGQVMQSKQTNTFVHVPEMECLDNNNALKFSQYNTGVRPLSSCSCDYNYPSRVVPSSKFPVCSPGIEDFWASPGHITSNPVECIENQRERYYNVIENNYCNDISPGFYPTSINYVNAFNPPKKSVYNRPRQTSGHIAPISKSPASNSGVIHTLTSSSSETRCNTQLKSNVPPSLPVESSLTLSPSVLSMSSFKTRSFLKSARCPSMLPVSLPEINLPGALRMPVVLIDPQPECDPVEELLQVMVCKEILDKEDNLDVLSPLMELLSED